MSDDILFVSLRSKSRLTPRSMSGHPLPPQVMDWARQVKLHMSRFGISVLSQWCLSRLYLNSSGSYWRKLWWPKSTPVTSCDVTQCKKCNGKVGRHRSSVSQQYFMCLSSDYIICVAKWAMSVHISPDRLIMGEVTWLTWPQMICMKNPRYAKCEYPGLLLSESFVFLRKIACHWQRCGILWPCGRLLITP